MRPVLSSPEAAFTTISVSISFGMVLLIYFLEKQIITLYHTTQKVIMKNQHPLVH
ncbi:hypothetical protein VRK_29690 [Vibrio sp. MEBiC08052]|nr:hypothetical protein VRK_29690 [Vibrio sp. MEBiC08052]